MIPFFESSIFQLSSSLFFQKKVNNEPCSAFNYMYMSSQVMSTTTLSLKTLYLMASMITLAIIQWNPSRPNFFRTNLCVWVIQVKLTKISYIGILFKVQFIQDLLYSGLTVVKPAHAVTSIKRSPFSCPLIENFIWI
jgi:hypothetical protein